MSSDHPIINCHTHIFTGDHVPPWLAKTFLAAPIYFLLPVSGIVAVFRWWYGEKGPNDFFYGATWKRVLKTLYTIRMTVARNGILNILSILLGIYITLNVFFFLYHLIAHLVAPSKKDVAKVGYVEGLLRSAKIIGAHPNTLLMLLFVFILLVFYSQGRKLILFVFNQLWKFMGMLPKKSTIELLKRYVLIGRFSRYENQSGIFSKLCGQYPQETGFVILPMDMRYMGAGKPKIDIRSQLDDLLTLKTKHDRICYPFVFADPHRLTDKTYFDYIVDANGDVILSPDCLIKQLLEDNQFSGIKIYPALGYFPFEEALLPIWKYASQNNLPVTTHCIKGTIFYRGSKEKDWDQHPVFGFPLLQRQNELFTLNFTHPLNYLCLLDETLLRTLVARAADSRIKQMFGYTGDNTPLERDLQKVKLCLAHFGGDDQWKLFMDRDRDIWSRMLQSHPDRGIEFLYTDETHATPTPGKPELLWNDADWYTIICSLMLQYPNTCADISYILHNPEILPLLQQTLRHPSLRPRVLYGTDFYVVRNHKSDKEMLADMMGGLSIEDFDQIARINPRPFLNLEL